VRLSIITINYNGSESTSKLLASLSEQTDPDFKTIVIDSASGEGDFYDLQNSVSKLQFNIELVRNEKNLGFSGGNNVGIKKALQEGAEWVLLLNNDAWVEKGFIAGLKLKLSKSGGIVGLPLIEGDYTAYYGKIRWLKSTLKHRYHPLYAATLRKNANYYAIGGGMAIHKNVFEKIGFLDEKYFLYFEDADFCIRASRAGINISFIDEPKARHQVSGTTKKLGSPLLLRYHYRNSLYFNFKNGPWYIVIAVWPWSFWVMKKQLLKIMFMIKRKESSAILKGVFDFYRNHMGKI
jgi:GT2 family glycosyltransferase